MASLVKKTLRFLTGRLFLCAALILLQMGALAALVLWAAFRSTAAFTLWWAVSLALALWVAVREENGSYKAAWVLLLLGLPPAGALLWLTWGRRGPAGKRKKALLQAKEEQKLFFQPDSGALEELLRKRPSLGVQAAYLHNISGFGPMGNTQVDYCPLGEEQLAVMLRELPRAEKFILLEYFILEPGEMWDSILAILRQKAQAGVEVRVLWDDMGCIGTLPPGTRRQLETWGISTLVYNPLGPGIDPGLNYRDHRKLCIIDGRLGICGGINLADEYINVYPKHGHWKDTAVLLRGDAVASLTLMFLTLWDFTTGTQENYAAYLPRVHRPEPVESDGFVQPYTDSPLDDETVGETVYMNLINKAKRYVYITTPYLIISNEMITALTTAAKSGLDVRIITPHIPDKWYVHALTRAYYEVLIEAGVRIFEYTPGFIHAKTFTVDDEYGVVGTINLDYRSLYLHFECAAWMYRCSCIQDMREDFLQTQAKSQEITLEQSQQVSPLTRLVRSVLRLFAPLM